MRWKKIAPPKKYAKKKSHPLPPGEYVTKFLPPPPLVHPPPPPRAINNERSLNFCIQVEHFSPHDTVHLDLSRCPLLHKSLQPPPWYQLL